MPSRSGSRLGPVIALGVLGVVCLAVAAILAWAVVPSQAKLPADENTTRQYDGTAKLLLNPQALSSGNLKSALVVDQPVTAARTVRTLATSADAAQVQDTRTLTTKDGQRVGQTQANYAVDRKTLAATANHPSSWQVANATGLTVSWPIGAAKKDYTGWVQETQQSTTLRYLRQETRQGLPSYVYQADTEPAQIKDPQVLDTLPSQLPVSTLQALSSVLPLSADLKAQLTAVLPQLTQPVPLSYTYQVHSTYWVEPTTGLVIDTQREEVRKAGLTVAGKTLAAVLPVFDVTTRFTATSVANAAADAKDKKNTIDRVGTTVPVILLVVGILALLAALLVVLVSRHYAGGTRPTPTDGTPTDAAAG